MEVTEKPPPAETAKLFKHPSSAPPHLLFSFANGALKRHQHQPPHRYPTKILYRECLKNHAATLGRHALDGCGEFMPSPNSTPSDPTSLKCAACGCHRNFHRRSDDTDDEEGDIDDAQFTPKRRRSSSPPAPLAAAAPQMLLALSAGHSGAVPVENSNTTTTNLVMPNANSIMVRKRFRTKFSREQKEKMYAFAEKLGWKMQKQDDGIVEEFCREVGVGKGVLKVWMHNHKHASSVKANIISSCNNTETNKNTENTNVVLNASSSSS